MRKLLVLLTVVAAGLLAVPAAQADSPHFIKASATINSSGQLVCTFKEAGLGNTLTVADISCSADATAVYQCFNNGGNHPKAGNKETVGGPVSNDGQFPVRNGQTTGSITVSPPGPGGFSCPNGQTLFLQSVSYTNIVLSGEGATADVPGTLSATVHTPA
ncbi:MAG TPA: hypothetical protein VGP67_09580 [Gaiellales bacterium]|jgi:hypothetical protein|nr:hypothetical protein [Gaiellales bacterium]